MPIRCFAGKLLNALSFWKYPYIKKFSFFGKRYLFKIQNRVEEYRVLRFGEEKEYVLRLLKSLKKNDTLYDIGASVGLFTVLSSKILSEGCVVAFEPDTESYNHLKENIKINKLTNVLVLPYAVTSKNAKVSLYTKGTSDRSPSIRPVQGFKRFINIKSVTLDKVIKRDRLPSPSVLKIDTEGSEMKVLLGAKCLLKSRKAPRNIFIETHPSYLKEFGSTEKQVLAFLKECNYEVVWRKKRSRECLFQLSKKV